MTTIRDTAKGYAAAGLPVFPIYGFTPDGRCACGRDCGDDAGKHPAVPSPGHHLATTDPATIDRWFDEAGDRPRNLGVAIPPGLVVLDVDPRNGGFESLAKLEAAGLPPTRYALTGGGGAHLWYAVPPDLRLNAKLGPDYPGVDIKQNPSGYVVVPPSTHRSGGTYRWAAVGGAVPPVAAAPDWIASRGRDRQATSTVAERTDRALDDAAAHALADVLRPSCVDGQKHALAVAFGGWARQRGFSRADVAAVMALLPFRQPAARLKAAEHAWTIDNAYGFEALRALGVDDAALSATPNPRLDADRKATDAALAPLLAKIAPRAEPVPDDGWFGLPPMGDEEPAPLASIVQGIDLVHGYTTAIVGRASNAKTPLALTLAAAIANGADWLGRSTIRSPVLYLCYEKPYACRRKRGRVARAANVAPKSVDLVDSRNVWLNETTSIDRVLRRVDRMQQAAGVGAVVFVDTYGSATVGLDHNASEYAEPLKLLSGELTKIGAACVPLLHCRKTADAVRLTDVEGHGSIVGALDAAIALSRPDETDPFTFAVSCVRPIEDGFATFGVKWSNVAHDGDPKWGLTVAAEELTHVGAMSVDEEMTQATNRVRTYIAGVLMASREPVSQKQLIAIMRCRHAIARAALKLLVENGELMRETVGGALIYRAPLVSERLFGR